MLQKNMKFLKSSQFEALGVEVARLTKLPRDRAHDCNPLVIWIKKDY